MEDKVFKCALDYIISSFQLQAVMFCFPLTFILLPCYFWVSCGISVEKESERC